MAAWGVALLGWPAAAAAQGTPAADSALLGALRRANPELAARRAALDAAQAGTRASGFAGPLRLSAEAEEIPDGLNLPGAGSLRVEVEREFLSPGRRNAQRALAGTDVRTAEAALRATEQRLLAEANRAVVRAAGAGLVARRLAADDSLLVGAEDALRAGSPWATPASGGPCGRRSSEIAWSARRWCRPGTASSDLGSGTGALALRLKRVTPGAMVTGVDPDP